MESLALIISIIALILSILAYQKVGGLGDQKKQSEVLSQIGDALIKASGSLREKTADILDKLETSLRTKETRSTPRKETKGDEGE
jgi:chromatin segregation and condensation protein Rec8/ScpA/Scc1 (kleisin family)